LRGADRRTRVRRVAAPVPRHAHLPGRAAHRVVVARLGRGAALGVVDALGAGRAAATVAAARAALGQRGAARPPSSPERRAALRARAAAAGKAGRASAAILSLGAEDLLGAPHVGRFLSRRRRAVTGAAAPARDRRDDTGGPRGAHAGAFRAGRGRRARRDGIVCTAGRERLAA